MEDPILNEVHAVKDALSAEYREDPAAFIRRLKSVTRKKVIPSASKAGSSRVKSRRSTKKAVTA